MTLSEEQQRVLILHLGGMADADTAREGERLLAESAEARRFADEVHRLTSAIEPASAESAPLSDAEWQPWSRLAEKKFGRDAQVTAHAAPRWITRRSLWFLTSAVAASAVLAVGLWRFTPWGYPKPAPVGRVWQWTHKGALSVRLLERRDLRGHETLDLTGKAGKMELGNAVIWISVGAELSLSDNGTTVDLRRGDIALDAPTGDRTLRVHAASGEAEFRSGVLGVSVVPDSVRWTCYRGEVTLRTPSGTTILPAGEAVRIIENGTEEKEPAKDQGYPRWVPGIRKAYEASLDGHNAIKDFSTD